MVGGSKRGGMKPEYLLLLSKSRFDRPKDQIDKGSFLGRYKKKKLCNATPGGLRKDEKA